MDNNILESIDKNMELLAEQGSELLLDSDEAYQAIATPLKTAEQIKAQAKRENEEYLKAEKLKSEFQQGLKLIYDGLPQRISPEDWGKINKEITDCENSLKSFLQGTEIKEPVYLQDILGLSDDTCWHFYDYAMELFKQSDYTNAKCVMELLVNLAPYAPSFWLSYAYCFQMQNQFTEAYEIYKVGKHMHPEHIPLIVFSADCNVLLKNYEEAYQEIQTAKKIIEGSKEKQEWEAKIKGMEYIIKSRRES